MKKLIYNKFYVKIRYLLLYSYFLFPFSTIFSQLNGSYTIPSGTYSTISSIVSALNTNGVTGPVVINILDGTYTENIDLKAVSGTSPTNTITFQSNSLDSSNVIIQYSTTNPNIDNFVIQFDASQHIIIKKLTFKALGSMWARVVSLKNSPGNLWLSNNVFNGFTGFSINNFQSLVFGDGSGTLNNINIENNKFNDGFEGINFNPTFGSNMVISGNDFMTNNKGIFIQNISAPQIIANTITNNSADYAIFLISCFLNSKIERNKINTINLGSGIFISNCNASSSNPLSIVNNFIQSSLNGIVLDFSEYINIYFNTINIENNPLTSDVNSTPIELMSANSRIDIQDNILVNRRDGYSYVGKNGFSNINDYNNLYTTGTNIAKWEGIDYTTFSNFITASGTNSNSYSTNLNFISISDLHIDNSPILLTGSHITSVPLDIDLENRNNPPYIGADEPLITTELSLTLFLEGPYSGPNMNNSINGNLPETQPYTAPIHSGSEFVSPGFFLSNTNIVDWVVVQLRSDINNKIMSRAGFLMTNGSIVDLDGSSPLKFENIFKGNYYIAIFHRNHLPIMSPTAITIN